MAIIEGTAYWASLTRPNEKFEPMWRIDLAVDSKDAEDFKGQGISLAETTVDEKTISDIVRFKRKVTKANGDKNTQPPLVDADKKPLEKIVGHGSRVKVMYKASEGHLSSRKSGGLDYQGDECIGRIV